MERYRSSSEENLEYMDSSRNCQLINNKYSMERPSIESFFSDGYYPPSVIGQDLEKLRRCKIWIEKKYEEKTKAEKERYETNKVRAGAMERFVHLLVKNKCFGENSTGDYTSLYDDYIQGVDLVIEIKDIKDEIVRRIGLAVDACSASSYKYIEKKMKKNIERSLLEKELPSVKYFKSGLTDKEGREYVGPVDNVLTVVVGVDKENADKIFSYFAEALSLEETNKERANSLLEKLVNHPAQDIFFQEIKVQLEMYKSIFEGSKKENSDYKKNYVEKLILLVDRIIEEKRSKKEYFEGGVPVDKTYNNIQKACKELSSSY